MNNIRRSSGFTLIELLVVIAIIGILSSAVIASVTTARAKARDANRLSQIKQIQQALTLYHSDHQTYPSSTPSGFTGEDAAIQFLSSAADNNSYLDRTPVPPPGGTVTFVYRGILADGTECTAVGDTCTSYALGIGLERDATPALSADADQSRAGYFEGVSADCISASATDLCYDTTQ